MSTVADVRFMAFVEWTVVVSYPEGLRFGMMKMLCQHLTPYVEEWAQFPGTQRELAFMLRQGGSGIAEETLSRWKRLPEYEEAVSRLGRSWDHKMIPVVSGANAVTAAMPGKDGVADRKLFFERMGLTSKTVQVKQETKVDITVRSARTMTLEELERGARRVIREKYPEASEEEVERLLDMHLELMMLEEGSAGAGSGSGGHASGDGQRGVEAAWQAVESPGTGAAAR